MPDIPKPMLSGIFLQIHLLVLYAVRFASLSDIFTILLQIIL